MNWRRSFVTWSPGSTKPLGNTIAKAGQGEPGTAIFPAGLYPACSLHGAMNRVAPAPLWRCLTCNIGVEIIARVGVEHLDRTFVAASCPSATIGGCPSP